MKHHLTICRGLLVTWIVFFSLGRIACGGTGAIKIGFVGDFSSVSETYTDNAFLAARMAVSDWNAAGGLLGRPVEMIHRDGGNDPQRHYRHVIELVRDKRVVAVFGGASSPCVIKASAACLEKGVPYLVSIGNAQSIVGESGHPFVFLFEPNSRMESLGFTIFATLMPWKRYAWIGADYSWGRGILGFFKAHVQQIGAPIEWAVEIWHPLGAVAYDPYVAQLIASQPDALVVATWGEDLRHFLRAAKSRELFDKMPAFGWFSLISDASERTLPEGIWNISRGPCNYLAEKHAQARHFLERFSQRYQDYPLDFTVCCYDSLLAWHQAVLNAGSAAPDATARALKGLRFTGLRGDSFIRAADGQMNCPVFFGRLVYRPEYPVAVIESVIEIPASKTWMAVGPEGANPSDSQ